MTNNFCKLLSNGLYITDKEDDKLLFSPCCLYNKKLDKIERNEWNNINNWVDNCDRCLVKEQSSKKSQRQTINNWFTSINDNDLRYLEIDYSNSCNAACGMCSSKESSTIAKILRNEGKNFTSVPTVKRQEFLKIIENLDFKNINVLKFRGGEPFKSNFHKKILNKVIKKKETIIIYQTNGSIYPDDEWWDMAKNFKKIHLSFSIDGVNERFNYIRANLNYDKVKTNIIKLITNSNIKLTYNIEATINPLNAFYFDEIFDLSIEFKKYNKSVQINWHQCWGDWGLENTPYELRKLITKKFKNNNLCQVINNFQFEQSKFINFVNNLQKHEKRFNFDTNRTFPEIYPLIIEEYKKLTTF